MINYIKKNPVLISVIAIVFILITRTTEIIPAILILLFIGNLPDYKRVKKPMHILSISYFVLAILYSIYRFVTMILQYFVFLSLPRSVFLLTAGFSVIIVLLVVVMFIVYFVLENRQDRNMLFGLALILPLIGSLYLGIEGYTINVLYDLMNVGGTGSISLGQIGLFSTLKIMILVYLLAKPKEELYE